MSLNSRLSRKQFKQQKEKERKQLIRKCNELRDEIRKNGYRSIPFPEPVFIGWTRYHVVREDILNSPDGEWATRILPLIANEQFSRRKDFKKKNSKKQIIDIPHDLHPINLKNWNDLKLEEMFPARIKNLFTLSCNKYNHWFYRFERPWWFESKIRRTYATHYKEFIGGEIQSELDRIHRKIWSEKMWNKESGRDEAPSDWMLIKFKFDHKDGKFKKIEIED